RRCRVDPVSVPPGCTQLRVDRAAVIASLARQDGLALGQGRQIMRVVQARLPAAHAGCCATVTGRAEKARPDQIEIVLADHSLHQDRTDHPAPPDKTDSHTGHFLLKTPYPLAPVGL